jgi:hypothetical protein
VRDGVLEVSGVNAIPATANFSIPATSPFANRGANLGATGRVVAHEDFTTNNATIAEKLGVDANLIVLSVDGDKTVTFGGPAALGGRMGGDGKVNFIAASTPTGNVRAQGTLTVNINSSAAGGITAINLMEDSKLTGTFAAGTASITTSAGSTIAPGNSVGSITAATISVAGSLNLETQGTGAQDKLIGNVTFAPTNAVNITHLGTPALGDSWDFIDGTITGTANLNLPALTGTLAYDTSAFQTLGIITVVPEPASLSLGLGGLLVLSQRRRRRA